MTEASTQDELAITDPFRVFTAAIVTIFIEGLGDKTFFISAFMSMKYNRVWFFCGATTALFIILGVSTAFGHLVNGLVPEKVLKGSVITVFFFFAFALFYQAIKYKDDEESEAKQEAEEEIFKIESALKMKKKEAMVDDSDKKQNKSNETHKLDSNATAHGITKRTVDTMSSKNSDKLANDTSNSKVRSRSSSEDSLSYKIKHQTFRFVYWQSFSLIFLGEWGDKSQIYTIALATRANPYAVFLGAFLGHSLVIVLALIGGKYIANLIPERLCLYFGASLYGTLAILGLLEL
jgi:putative Ca2+/H+ antiporter (TMEM165/GDT1 family)